MSDAPLRACLSSETDKSRCLSDGGESDSDQRPPWADERQGYLVPWADGTVVSLGDAVATYAAEVATSILMDFTTDYPDITMTFDRWDNLREIIKERMEDGFPLDVVGAKPRV